MSRTIACCKACGTDTLDEDLCRRCARRAEVEGLVRTVRAQTDLAARHTALGEMNGDEVDEALSRLAALALEGDDHDRR